MRALLFHARDYKVEIDSLANRPEGILPEETKGKEKQECKDCIVAFITVEKGDKEEIVVKGISHEIQKMCKEVKRKKAVIVPFAHLSNNLAEPKHSLKIIKEIESNLKEKIAVIATHFGSNKSLLLDIYGHTGNVRYREFYSASQHHYSSHENSTSKATENSAENS